MATRLLICLVFSIALNGCAKPTQPLTLIPIADSDIEPPSDTPEGAAGPISPDTSFITDNSPELTAALKQFAATGKAPIVKHAGFVQFPFGEVQPILNCQPNYGCDIELQAGEQVKAVILGNEPLWDYLVWESNQQQKAVSHVTIGPRTSQARTNAIIGTDRRTYHLELLSTTKSDYTRSAKFYYPRERLREFQARQSHKQRAESDARGQLTRDITQGALLPYQYVSFGWDIDADDSLSWKPVRVFDDGAHVYVQFPENVVFEDFPGVYAPVESGLMQPNWRTVKPESGKSRETGTYIMVDGMFGELRLIRGFGGKQETVTIRKK